MAIACGVLLLLASPAALNAQFTYTTNNGTITITGYTGSGGDVTIPDTIAGLPVTSIGATTFYRCTTLTSVTIGSNVTTIGVYRMFYGCTGLTAIFVDPLNPTYSSLDGVLFDKNQTRVIYYPMGKTGAYIIPDSVLGVGMEFLGCTNLTGVTIGNGANFINDNAFMGCTGLTRVTLGNSVGSIEEYAFADCASLTNVTFVNGLFSTSIMMYAFDGCTSLASITIGTNMVGISSWAFPDCTNFTEINVDPLSPVLSSLDGVLFNKSQTELKYYPAGRRGAYIIPGSVTNLAYYAFSGCAGLTSVTIPDSVTNIAPDTFSGCTGLTRVIIPDNVTSIGEYAFSGCTSLTNVTLGNSVTNIGDYAFSGCTSLTGFDVNPLNPTYSSLDGVLFNKLQTMLILCPGGKTGAYVVPDSVTSIGSRAFYRCTGLTSVTIPDSVTSIGASAFYGCTGLTSVVIPDSLARIGDTAFYYCTSLTSLTIGKNVTEIGGAAFHGCTSLIAIDVDPLNPTYSSLDGVLFDKNRTTLIQCPKGKKANYSVPDSVISIGWRAFYGCSRLTSVIIPDGVVWIGEQAFYGCIGLTSVIIPASASGIGSGAFYDCTSLRSAYFRGNALPLPPGYPPFTQANNVTIYYLPGTTGWGPTYADRPSALWAKPVVLEGSLGVEGNTVGFTIAWAPDVTVVVEASTTLTNPTWFPVSTNVLAGGVAQFRDPEPLTHPGRFYRLRSP